MSPVMQLLFSRKMIASSLLSVIWVSSYGYQYNIAVFNTHAINIWAFTLWAMSGYIFLYLYYKIKNRISGNWLQLAASWVVYLAGLLAVEYTGYNILGIRESSSRGSALIFGLIHGNTLLHTYYMLFPALILVVYQLTLMVPAKTAKLLLALRHTERRFTTWP